MKTTMRDKVCQLIGKYQFLEEDFLDKAFLKASMGGGLAGFYSKLANLLAVCAAVSGRPEKLLEEDEPQQPRRTPARPPRRQVVRGLSGTGS